VTTRTSGVPASSGLLAGLPGRSRQDLLTSSEQVELDCAAVFCGLGEKLRRVHFPTSFISLLVAFDADERLEVGSIDDEVYRQVHGAQS
jgi:hypothetical protein